VALRFPAALFGVLDDPELNVRPVGLRRVVVGVVPPLKRGVDIGEVFTDPFRVIVLLVPGWTTVVDGVEPELRGVADGVTELRNVVMLEEAEREGVAAAEPEN